MVHGWGGVGWVEWGGVGVEWGGVGRGGVGWGGVGWVGGGQHFLMYIKFLLGPPPLQNAARFNCVLSGEMRHSSMWCVLHM